MTNESRASPPTAPRVVSVLGMHRSGTSLISRVLSLLGYYLGPDEQIMPPNVYNQEGYWEHLGLTGLNDEILRRLGGAWDRPPGERMDRADPRLADLEDAARALVERDFAGKEFWAWKDPRTSLTLPFWQSIVPAMRYVICVRNPQEVAASLLKRDQLPVAPEQGLNLWFTYTAAAIENSAGGERLFTFYEDWFKNPELELARLAAFVKRPLPRKASRLHRQITGVIKEDLRHNETGLVNVLDSVHVEGHVKSLYFALRLLNAERPADGSSVQEELDGALTVFTRRLADQYAQTAAAHAALVQTVSEHNSQLSAREQELQLTRELLRARENEIVLVKQLLATHGGELSQASGLLETLQRDLTERDRRLTELSAALSEREDRLSQLSGELSGRDQRLAAVSAELKGRLEHMVQLSADVIDLSGEVRKREAELRERDTTLARAHAAVSSLGVQVSERTRELRESESAFARISSELAGIQARPGFQIVESLRSFASRIAPWGSLRGNLVATVVRGLAYFFNLGPWAFFLRILQPWRWLPRMFSGRDPGVRPRPVRPPNRFRAAIHRGMGYRRYLGWRGFFKRLLNLPAWLPKLWRKQWLPEAPVRLDLGHGEAHPSRSSAFDLQYGAWLPSALAARTAATMRTKLTYEPLISLILPVDASNLEYLGRTLTSIKDQAYAKWEVCVATSVPTPAVRSAIGEVDFAPRRLRIVPAPANGATSQATLARSALARAKGEFIGFIEPGDELRPIALREVVQHLNTDRSLDYLYSDEDKRDDTGAYVRPFFKPGWSPDLLLGVNYVRDLGLMRKSLLDAISIDERPEVDWRYDLALRITEQTSKVGHIAFPVISKRFEEPDATGVEMKALSEALVRRGIDGSVEETPVPGWFRLRRRLTSFPLVSVIIPTRDKADFLARCLDSIEKSTYPNLEVVIVDNGSVESETHRLLSSRDLIVVRRDEPFNFSRVINAGAAAAKGDYLLILNNDTEAINEDWIEELVTQASQPDVGVVGARLLYADGTPQHEGVAIITRQGVPLHTPHLSWRSYAGFSYAVREIFAVTAAAVMTPRSVFEDLAGLDERFRVTYGDIDFCLRAQARGLRVLYTPYAELYHFEGASRGALTPKEDEALAKSRWGQWQDPYYNYAFEEVVQPFAERPSRWVAPMESLTNSFKHGSLAVAEDKRPAPLFGVNVAGFLTSEKGVGEAVRATLRGLDAGDVPYALNDEADPASRNNESLDARFVKHNPYWTNLICINAAEIPAFVAGKDREYFMDRYNIGLWTWELPDFPDEWVPNFNYLQEVWTPSAFVSESMSRVSPVPVLRVPYPVRPDYDYDESVTRSAFGFNQETFLFLFIFDHHSFMERKNPLGTVAAFKKAFGTRKDVGLLIKSSRAEFNSGGDKQLRLAAAGANVAVVDSVLERPGINALYRMCDAYVSLHRSEGYGFTLLEAMTAGKPVIATGYGGNVDFMNAENSYLVRHKPCVLGKDYGPYKKGMTWADPDVAEAAELMRMVSEDREEAKKRALRGRNDVLESLSPEAVGAIMKQRLQHIYARTSAQHSSF